jgi:predicted DNA-binding antitoxin AbrB/MazE fold protein
MIRTVEAVYEQGVLRPLTPVGLAEAQRVKLIIADVSGGARRDMAVVERARAEVNALSAPSAPPTIEQVREALASIPGSLSDDVIAERETTDWRITSSTPVGW